MPLDGTHFPQWPLLERIDRVISLLEDESRWCKGVMRSPDGRRCLVGALVDADAVSLVKPALLQAIRETTGTKYWRVELFNDAESTTHAQVLAALYRAREIILQGQSDRPTGRARISALWHRLARGWF